MRAIRGGVRPALLLLVLVGVVVGVPCGLGAFFGSSVPDRVPRYGDVKTWLDNASLVPAQTLTDVLVWIAWGLWALFTLQIAVQLPAVAIATVRSLRTGVALPAVAHANLAGRLLTTAAMSVVAAKGTLGVAAASTGGNGAELIGPKSGPVSVASKDSVHVVAAGECLWDIAHRYLGDGERWGEIFELNRHRVQNDGGVLADPDVIRPGWLLMLPRGGNHAPTPHAVLPTRSAVAAASARAAASVPRLPTQPGSARASENSARPEAFSGTAAVARPVVRRPVAVDLPAGGYVSLTLGAGFAAALAAARIRSRVRPRQLDPAEPITPTPRLGDSETALLQAAVVLGFHDEDDPYVDSPDEVRTQAVTYAVAGLRAPEAVYIGVRDGRPISLESAARDGLTLSGDGAADTARALLLSCLTAGGFLADSVAFPVVTTQEDLRVLLGDNLAGRRVEHLTSCVTYSEAVETANRSVASRCLLLATPAEGDERAVADHVVPVYLGGRRVTNIVAIDRDFEMTAGDLSQGLDGAAAYHLGFDEARELFSQLPLVWAELDASEHVPPEAGPSAPPDMPKSAPIPPQASHAKPVASEAITINVLGPVQILHGGRDMTAEVRAQLAALLTYLALHRNGVSRAALAADLWPEDDPTKHRARLTTALSHTRTALATVYGGKPDFFPKDRTAGVAYLNPEYFESDVWQFDELTRRRDGMETVARTEALASAVELYRGEVAYMVERANKLTEPYENWLRPFREEYWKRVISAHQTLARLLRSSDPERALDTLDRAIRMEPWNQGLYEALISIHLDLGQRHAAERRLRELTDLLASLGTRPTASIAKLFQAYAV